MATSSRMMSASTSAFDGRRAYKRARYSNNYRQKVKASLSFLGFEAACLKPTRRSFLNIDARFFPIGLHPTTILEIKGPQKSGKTFVLAYFIARVLTTYPDKKVVLIDTRHKFSLQNLVSILSHFDQELKKILQANLDKSVSCLAGIFPKIRGYLDRFLIIKCYSAEDLFFTVGPTGESTVEKLLLSDPKVCLVAVDSIDNYSFAESLQSIEPHLWPNVMQDLKQALGKTGCPGICTTLMPVGKREYRRKGITSTNFQGSGSQDKVNSDEANAGCEAQSQHVFASNVQIDYSIFSNIMELVPATQAEIERGNHYVTAYLRSKHNANTAGSGGNHRVRFSIFSDMLWVEGT